MDTLTTAIRTDVDGLAGNERRLVKLWADKVNATIWQLWIDPVNGVMMKGEKSGGHQFSANLCLAVIREFCPWTNSEYAALTDYPEMATSGDWSGVRDTEDIMPLYLKVLNDLIDAGTL